jgi:WD40 repeat protein
MTFIKPIYSMHFSYQGYQLALGGESGILYVIDLETWQLIKETELSHTPIQSVRFSRSDYLAVGAADGVVTLLDPERGWEVTGEIVNDSSVLSLDWSSKSLAIGREDGTITIHEADKLLANFYVPQTELARQAPVRSLAFGARGRCLGMLTRNGSSSFFSCWSHISLVVVVAFLLHCASCGKRRR